MAEKIHPKVKTEHGYILVFVGKDHNLADVRGYCYEHRLVAQAKIGRPLLPSEPVHHIDGNRENNDPENLEVTKSHAHHLFLHRKGDRGKRRPDDPNPTVLCACGCGTYFKKYDESNRPRKFVSGHNAPASPTVDAILAVLKDGQAHIGKIAELIGKDEHIVTCAISKMKKNGLVEKVRKGIYRMIPTVSKPELNLSKSFREMTDAQFIEACEKSNPEREIIIATLTALQRLSVEELMILFPDNCSLYHDSGTWSIINDAVDDPYCDWEVSGDFSPKGILVSFLADYQLKGGVLYRFTDLALFNVRDTNVLLRSPYQLKAAV